MIQVLIGQKLNQTQKFLQNGQRIPVTEVAVSDNTIVQVKNLTKDSYTAIQLGFGARKNPNNALAGHAKKSNLPAPQVIKEVKITDTTEENMPKAGDAVKAEEVFKPGDIVDITGTSKGKGFAGVVKRHNFRGGPKTHGQSDRLRAPGSIGQTTTPGRVYRGKRMAGRMGQDTVTIKNLQVVDIDPQNHKLYIKGLVPGARNSILFITRTGEDKTFSLLHKIEEPKEALAQTEAPQSPSEASEKPTKGDPISV